MNDEQVFIWVGMMMIFQMIQRHERRSGARADVDGGVEVALTVFGKKIRSANAEAEGAGKLLLGHARMVMFQADTRINCPAVKVFQLFEFGENKFFNGLGQRDIVRRKD